MGNDSSRTRGVSAPDRASRYFPPLVTAQPLTPIPPEQSQLHGEQLWPGAHAGQAHTQPPPPPPLAARWQTPLTHLTPGVQGAPIAYHMHTFVVSAVQLAESVCSLHGSVVPQSHGGQGSPGMHAGHAHVVVGGGAGGGTPPSQLQPQGGQDSPTRHSGHPHTQVLPHSVPPLLPPPHAQPQGGQASPGAHGGHAHVQVPPPRGSQSQAHVGQSPTAGQYAGHAQRHASPPLPGE